MHRESLGSTVDQFYLFACMFAESNMSSQTFRIYACLKCICECTERVRVKRVHTESVDWTLD